MNESDRMNKKIWLLFLLFPFYGYSSCFTDFLAGTISVGKNFLASEMFSEAGDHYGPVDEHLSELPVEEKRKRMADAAEKRRDEEKKAQESLRAYLRKQKELHRQNAEYVWDKAAAEFAGQKLPEINSFELQEMGKQ